MLLQSHLLKYNKNTNSATHWRGARPEYFNRESESSQTFNDERCIPLMLAFFLFILIWCFALIPLFLQLNFWRLIGTSQIWKRNTTATEWASAFLDLLGNGILAYCTNRPTFWWSHQSRYDKHHAHASLLREWQAIQYIRGTYFHKLMNTVPGEYLWLLTNSNQSQH